MNPVGDLKPVLDRIANGHGTQADLNRLRSTTRVRGDGNSIQIGKYNVTVGGNGREIRVGDNIRYYGMQAHNLLTVLDRVVDRQPISFDRGGPTVARGGLRSFGGFIFTIGALGLIIGVLIFLLGMLQLMQMGDNFSESFPPPMVVTGFGIAAVGMVVTWVGALVRGWERRN